MVGYLIKCVADTSAFALVMCVYVALLVIWGYTRLYAYPVHILYSSTFESTIHVPQHALAHHGLSVLLWTLMGLHIYWYGLFLQMGKVAVTKGKTEDIQQKAGEHNLKKKGE